MTGGREILREREAETGLIESALGFEGPQVVLIEGSAGIGKTCLLEDARERARASGFRGLWARGGELESGLDWEIARQMLAPALASATRPEREELLDGAGAFARPVIEPSPGESSVAG